MNKNIKKYGYFSLLYGVIIALVNFMGFMLPGTGNIPLKTSLSWDEWMSFMDRNSNLITGMTVFVFLVPAIICILYIRLAKDKLEKRMLNLPLAYSLIGSLGWLLSFFLESVTLLIVKF